MHCVIPGTGCSSSQQLLVVDDTSESTVSMMSFGVTSSSPGLPATPVSRAGGGKESKKKKSGTGGGKKLQENNASEDEAEEKWLMAIEAGKLEEVRILIDQTENARDTRCTPLGSFNVYKSSRVNKALDSIPLLKTLFLYPFPYRPRIKLKRRTNILTL